MGWEVEDIEATVEWLRACGVVFEEYDFPDLRTVNRITEVELAEEPEWGIRRDALAIHSLNRMGDAGPVRRCDIL